MLMSVVDIQIALGLVILFEELVMNFYDQMQFEISKLKGVEHVDVVYNDSVHFDHYTQLVGFSFRVIVAIGPEGKLKKIAKIVWKFKQIGVLVQGNTPVTFKDILGLKHTINLEVV